ncbi:MAG: phage major capsid protein [Rhodococcus sp. (in: high G+C Gram-positive bacteria)]
MYKTIEEIRARLENLRTEGRSLVERADQERGLEGADLDRFDEIAAEMKALRDEETRITTRQAGLLDLVNGGATEAGSGGTINRQTGGAQTRDRQPEPSLKGAQLLTRDDSYAQWSVDNGRTQKSETRAPSADLYLKGMLGGGWEGASLERGLAEGSSTAGGLLVPAPISANVIDLARSKSQLVNAGVTVVPMQSATVTVPRITSGPGPSFRAEAAAIVQNDIAFTGVTLTARSVARIVRVSRELIMDAPQTSKIVEKAMADSLAAAIDQVGLFGSGTAPEPRGLLNVAAIPVLSHGANGGAVNYDFLLQAAGAVRAANYEPTAHIVSTRSALSLQSAKDSTGAYLAAPQGLLPILATTRVPNDVTVGTSNDTSYVFSGDYSMLYLGVRESLELTWLTERFADTGEVAALMHARVDFQVADPNAFVIDKGVRA